MYGTFLNEPAGATYTLPGSDIPFFLVHLNHQSRQIKFEVFDASSGRDWHEFGQVDYVIRNTSATSSFPFAWDGTTAAGKELYTVPNGSYVAQITVLKALGDPSNPADTETWTSPVITIARP